MNADDYFHLQSLVVVEGVQLKLVEVGISEARQVVS